MSAVADANSVVFAQRCASAYAKLDGMVNMLKDSLEDTYDSVSNACANGAKGDPVVNSQVGVLRGASLASPPLLLPRLTNPASLHPVLLAAYSVQSKLVPACSIGPHPVLAHPIPSQRRRPVPPHPRTL